MSLSLLNKAAAESAYIKFDDLEVGKYKVVRFSIMKESCFDKQPRLLCHLKNGYVILPARCMRAVDKPNAVEKLNK